VKPIDKRNYAKALVTEYPQLAIDGKYVNNN
jgi:hypothetical protein